MTDDLVVELLKLELSDLNEPVRAVAAISYEKTVEESCGARVQQNLGQVLAADEVDPVDTEIRRDCIIPRRTLRSFPLDPPWRPTTKSIGCHREHTAILEGGTEVVSTFTVPPRVTDALPGRLIDVDQAGRSGRKRLFEAGSEHAERRREFGDLGQLSRQDRSILEEWCELEFMGRKLDVRFRVVGEGWIDVDSGSLLHPDLDRVTPLFVA